MEGQKTFYCNNMGITMGLYDFSMHLKMIAPIPNEQKIEEFVRDEMDLLMSPQHAKIMAIILEKHVREYEKNFGPITLPKDLVERFTK